MIKKRGLMQISKNKRAQIWIETVTYTLIGLTIIGALMAVLLPRIQQMQDKATINEITNSLNSINNQFTEVSLYSGSQREIFLRINKGFYTLDPVNEVFYYTLKDSGLKYSQPGESIQSGDIIITTIAKSSKKYDITLLLNYSSFNITYQDKDVEKVFAGAAVPYRLLIQNKDGPNKQINFEQI